MTIAAVLAACKEEGTDEVEDTPGLMGISIFFPYPSVHLMKPDSTSQTGWRLDIPAEILPIAEGGTPMPVDRFNFLDGFSPASPMLVYFEGITIDQATVPGPARIDESIEENSPVQIINLETGDRHPLMAEVDAQPQAIELGKRPLIIRPMKIMEWATHYAVVLTTDIKDSEGRPLERPANFASLVDHEKIPPNLRDSAGHYDELFSTLESHGMDMDNVVLAWDFWTGSKEVTLSRFNHIIERTREDLPADPDFEPVYETKPTRSLDSDIDPDINPLIWRHEEMTFELETYVNEEGVFELDDEGLPKAHGKDDFELIIHLPPSIHDAPAGSVPVLIFGHGFLGLPHDYLVREGDQLRSLAASERYGFIYAAAEWRGLSYRDTVDAALGATDFGKFHHITEDLHMGIANVMAVARMFRTKFADAPFFQASDGSGSLVDADRIYYFGISLGGTAGGIVLAHSQVIDYGILQVGGCPWTTILERSSHWVEYTVIINSYIRDPLDRQMLYAVSQMLWDPVDQTAHIDELKTKSVLMQEAIGDAQLSNLATEFCARSLGFPLVTPSEVFPPLFETVEAPVGPGGSGLFIYSPQYPECGPFPSETNIPAEDNCAHGIIWKTEAHHQQVEAFFEKDNEGTIIHPPDCGEGPCTPARR
ncbi:MAG: hypothetical protein ABIJ56_22115 [Pseudomonadota bacterium]